MHVIRLSGVRAYVPTHTHVCTQTCHRMYTHVSPHMSSHAHLLTHGSAPVSSGSGLVVASLPFRLVARTTLNAFTADLAYSPSGDAVRLVWVTRR